MVTISRDQLMELLHAPYGTVNSWWNRGHLAKPKDVGSGTRQGRYTLDEALEIAVFDAVMADTTTRRKLSDAAVAARFFSYRRGALAIMAQQWKRPIELTVYPAFDFTGLNFSKDMLKETTERVSQVFLELKRREREEGYEPTKDEDDSAYAASQLTVYLRDITQQTKEPEYAHLFLEDYRRLHDGYGKITGDFEVLDSGAHIFFVGQRYLVHVDLYSRLVLESWAVANLPRALLESPFRYVVREHVEQFFTVDIDHIVTALWEYAKDTDATS